MEQVTVYLPGAAALAAQRIAAERGLKGLSRVTRETVERVLNDESDDAKLSSLPSLPAGGLKRLSASFSGPAYDRLTKLSEMMNDSPGRIAGRIVASQLTFEDEDDDDAPIHVRAAPRRRHDALDVRGLAFTPRPEQIQLWNRISASFIENPSAIVMAEAGTGVGKSVVLNLFARKFRSEGRRVIVAAPTVENLVHLIREAIEPERRIFSPSEIGAWLGKTQFLSDDMLADVLREIDQDPERAGSFPEVLEWLTDGMPPTTQAGQTLSKIHAGVRGLAADLRAISPDFPIARLHATRGEIDGDPREENETPRIYSDMRDQAKARNVIYMTHAMLATQIITPRDRRLIGDDFDILLDEAHKFEDALVNVISRGVSLYGLKSRLVSLEERARALVERGKHASSNAPRDTGETYALFNEFRDWVESAPRDAPGAKPKKGRTRKGKPAADSYKSALEDVAGASRGLTAAIDALAKKLTTIGVETEGRKIWVNSTLDRQTDKRALEMWRDLGVTDAMREALAAFSVFRATGWYRFRCEKRKTAHYESLISAIEDAVFTLKAFVEPGSAHIEEEMEEQADGARRRSDDLIFVSFSPRRFFPSLDRGPSRDRAFMYLRSAWKQTGRAILFSGTLYHRRDNILSTDRYANILCIPQGHKSDPNRLGKIDPVHTKWSRSPRLIVPDAASALELTPPGNRDPASAEAKWLDSVARRVVHDIAATARGGTLVAMTGYDRLNGLRDAIRRIPGDLDGRLVIQSREGGKAVAEKTFVEMYKRGERPVWLGAGQVWTGLDLNLKEVPPWEDFLLSDLVIPSVWGGVESVMDAVRRETSFLSAIDKAFDEFRQVMGRTPRREGVRERRIWVLDGRCFNPANPRSWTAPFVRFMGEYKDRKTL